MARRASKKISKPKKKQNREVTSKYRPSMLSYILILFSFVFLANFLYQLVVKPAEVLNLIVGNEILPTQSTWEKYEEAFVEHSTEYMTPDFLAAMAQLESGGNSLASPPWKWSFNGSLASFYAPSSSSVGLFQFTLPTYLRAKKYCIHEGQVKEEGKWYEWNTCWFNGLYSRIIGSHSIEMASAFLHRSVENIMSLYAKRSFNLKNIQRLAAVIHLCGEGVGKEFVRRGFSMGSRYQCGAHNLLSYLKKMERLKMAFNYHNKGQYRQKHKERN